MGETVKVCYECKNCGGELVVDEPSGWWTHVSAPPRPCSPEPCRDEYFGMPVMLNKEVK